MLILSVVLAGCFRWPQNELNVGLREALAGPGSSISVVFEEVFPQEWSTLVLVCDDTSRDAIRAAVGEAWQVSEFDAGFILVDDERVVLSFDSGDESGMRDIWINPCTPAARLESPQETPLVLSRADAVVTFTTFGDDSEPRSWGVDEAEFERLSGLAQR